MPNDAKLGHVLGIGLVILVAVLFFGKELVPDASSATPASALSVTAPATADETRADERPKAQTTSNTRPSLGEVIAPVATIEEVVAKRR